MSCVVPLVVTNVTYWGQTGIPTNKNMDKVHDCVFHLFLKEPCCYCFADKMNYCRGSTFSVLLCDCPVVLSEFEQMPTTLLVSKEIGFFALSSTYLWLHLIKNYTQGFIGYQPFYWFVLCATICFCWKKKKGFTIILPLTSLTPFKIKKREV